MKTFKIISIYFIAFIICYLFTAFIKDNIDATTWPEGARLAMVLVYGVFAGIYSMIRFMP